MSCHIKGQFTQITNKINVFSGIFEERMLFKTIKCVLWIIQSKREILERDIAVEFYFLSALGTSNQIQLYWGGRGLRGLRRYYNLAK